MQYIEFISAFSLQFARENLSDKILKLFHTFQSNLDQLKFDFLYFTKYLQILYVKTETIVAQIQ